MQSDVPKQFLEVEGKPIIVYSIENFQRNPQIEKIVVVCVKGWIERVKALIDTYALTKVEWVIEGGASGHDSIRMILSSFMMLCAPCFRRKRSMK